MKRELSVRLELLILLFLTVLLVGLSSCKMDPGGNPPVIARIAYVYHIDDSEGQLFKTFLEGNGYSVSLYETDNIGSANFNAVNIFLIGNSADSTVWDSSAKTEMITGTGKPIVGLCEGASVFAYLSQHLTWGGCMGWSGTPNNTIRPHEFSHPLWNTPNNLGISTSDPVQIYTDDGFHRIVGLLQEGTDPVEYLAQRDQDGSLHYPIAVQDFTAFWGFARESLSEYNETLKNLFMNLLTYMLTK